MSGKNLVEVKNLVKHFPIHAGVFQRVVGQVRAVDGISFNIKEGQTMGLVGESGCGKTTVGRTMIRLYEPTSGNVFFDGVDVANMKKGGGSMTLQASAKEGVSAGVVKYESLRKMRPKMQMIFQDPYSSLSPRMPVGDIIGEAVLEHKIVTKSEYRDYVMEVMDSCGLQPHQIDRYPHEFSGGQRQRICIARALALKPKFLIADEPVSALDVSIQAQIINLLRDLQKENNFTYLFVSHDLSVVEHISDTVGVMYLGSMVEMSVTKDIFDTPLHPYTKALLSAVPIPDPKAKSNRTILEGDIPSPANPPSGCKFHTRCPHCQQRCKEEVPELRDAGSGHLVACHFAEQLA